MKFVAFGDSFVNIFLSLKNDNFDVIKYKGAPIKGLINKNEHYENMVSVLNKKYYDIGFFVFGQVDWTFYYYYKKYYQKEDVNIYEFAERYVKMISELPNIKEKYILNVQPSSIRTNNYIDMLKIYRTNKNIDYIDAIPKKDILLKKRQSRLIKFNKLLKYYCNKYNVHFVDAFDKMINKENYHINKIFLLKYSPKNIHINFERTLLTYIKCCIQFITKYYDIDKLLQKMEKSYNQYMKHKLKKHGLMDQYNKYKFDAKDVYK